MNAPVRMGAPHSDGALDVPAAMVTASYAPDFARCRLLCETADRHVSGMAHHYILVEGRDIALFRQLETPRRTVVDERDILPAWLRPYDDPLSGFRRRIWLSLRTQPLRGWHVQQLRRIAIAAHVEQQLLVFCDSDVAFVKPFDMARFRRHGLTRLFRRDGALSAPGLEGHRVWSANAGRVLGLSGKSTHDYVSTLISWDRDTVRAMCERIEAVTGKSWVAALGARRRFSECLLYGRFVDEFRAGAGHFHGSEEFCRVHWTGEPLDDAGFRRFIETMSDDQFAIGMQSFIGTDVGRIRKLLLDA